MAVIRCQACGKPNPDIIDECQYCGARLKPLIAGTPSDQTLAGAKADVIRCPACGRDNPGSLDVCQYCQARLKPLAAAGEEGAAAPGEAGTPAPGDDALARLRASTQVPEEPEPEGEPEEPEPEAGPADWMSRLRGFGAAAADETLAAPAAGQAEPDWLWSGPAGEDEAAPPKDEGETLDWLRPEPPPPSAPDEAETLPDWMDEAPPAVPGQPRTREVPSWLRPEGQEPHSEPARPKLTDWLETPAGAEGQPPTEPPSEPEQPQEPPPAEPGPADETLVPTSRPRKKMTDWLLSTATLVSKSAEPKQPEPQADLPDWLKAMQPSDEMPDWLHEQAGPAPAPPAEEKPPAEPAAAQPAAALPDWLQALRDAQLGAAAAEPEAAAPPSGEPEQGPPEWMPAIPPGQAPPPTPTPTPPVEVAPEPAAVEVEPGASDETLVAPPPEAAESEAAWPLEGPAAAEAELAAETPASLAPLVSAEDVARAADELPEWLRNLAPPAEGEAPAAELPDWLRPLEGPAVPPAPEAPGAPADLAAGEAVPAPSQPAPPQVGAPEIDAETMSWLSSVSAQPLGAEAAAAAPAPEWLSDLAAATAGKAATGEAEQAPAEAEEAVPAAVPTPEEEMPDWLRALRGLPAEEAKPQAEMPDWLRNLRGMAAVEAKPEAAAGAEPATAEQAAEAAAQPAAGALPGWRAAMVPAQPAVAEAAAAADDYEENLGVLAGMRGVLRAEPVIAQPHKSTTPVHRLAVAETHAAQAAILTDLLQQEPTLHPPARTSAAVAVALERWVVFAVFALAIVLAQFVLPAAFPAPTTIRPEAKAAFDVVEQVPDGQPALVAFDYDPAQQGELGPGAVAVVTHLLRRGVPVVAVSARPMGAAVAQAVLTQVAADLSARMSFSYTYGTHYLNLGYVPGGPVGMQEFAAAPRALVANDFTGAYPDGGVWNTLVLANVTRLQDFGLVVLVSATPDGARAWIEQTQIYAANTKRLAVVSAGAEPMVQPYLEGQAPQLHGLVSGLVGAAQYELQAEVPGEANARWSALGGGLLMAALLIGAGNIVFALMGLARRRRWVAKP